MADYTLRNIPEDLYQRAAAAAESGFRSLNQGILFCLQKSFDADGAPLTALHARWMAAALESGPATPLKSKDLEKSFERGRNRANRRTTKSSA